MKLFFSAVVAFLPMIASSHAFPEEALRELSRVEKTVHVARDFWLLGFEHIITGTDHILFLVALFVVPLSIRQVLRLTGIFSVAHTLTFFVAALGLFTLPAALVEPLIAFSIAFVALGYLRKGFKYGRGFVVFVLGLVHGLGFADALLAFDPSPSVFLPAVVSFNVGVEIGQMAIAALILPFVYAYRDKAWYPKFLNGVAVSLGVVGGLWGFSRVL